MNKIKCPYCKKSSFYFDSPSLIAYNLIYHNSIFYFEDNVRHRKVPRTIERTTVFEAEISDPTWCWTCNNCDYIIENDSKVWKQLKKAALEYLAK